MARRYEFYVRVARTVSHSFAALTREILFLPLEHKIHIFSPLFNILLSETIIVIVAVTRERQIRSALTVTSLRGSL